MTRIVCFFVLFATFGSTTVRLEYTPFQSYSTPQIWIAPAPGSLDLVDLLREPEEFDVGSYPWPTVKRQVGVFQFYSAHLQLSGPDWIGSNTYTALVARNAFSGAIRRGFEISLEVPAIKEWNCDVREPGAQETIEAVERSQRFGGTVRYLALDEPFTAALHKCHLDTEIAAQKLALYSKAVKRAHPNVEIGLIEPYPTFESGEELAILIAKSLSYGAEVRFFHLDIDLKTANQRGNQIKRDLDFLQNRFLKPRGIKFGVIIWGENGDTDRGFAADTQELVVKLKELYDGPENLPDRLIFQSWAVPKNGIVRLVPRNLPEWEPHSLTWVVRNAIGCLVHGQSCDF